MFAGHRIHFKRLRKRILQLTVGPGGVTFMIDIIQSWKSSMAVGKVIRMGRSQAIRLPKEFRVDVDVVLLKRTAEGFLVIIKDPWDVFFEGVEKLSDNFFIGGRVQPRLESRD